MIQTSLYNESLARNDEEALAIRDHFKWLKSYLKYKYRDSFLYTLNKNISN